MTSVGPQLRWMLPDARASSPTTTPPTHNEAVSGSRQSRRPSVATRKATATHTSTEITVVCIVPQPITRPTTTAPTTQAGPASSDPRTLHVASDAPTNTIANTGTNIGRSTPITPAPSSSRCTTTAITTASAVAASSSASGRARVFMRPASS